MKYIYINDKINDKYWEQCEKKHAPFIELRKINDKYVNIFYDVTNYKIDLECISNDIKELYTSYIKFFMIEPLVYNELYEQYYFFNLIVKTEHSEFLAENLHDYLIYKINEINQ